jgi:hypothetical protein
MTCGCCSACDRFRLWRPTPGRALLEHGISEVFGLADPIPGPVKAAMTQVADRARAAGMEDLWMLGPSRAGVWLSTWRYPNPGVEVDLELRPVPLPGWDDIWDIRIDSAVECDCGAITRLTMCAHKRPSAQPRRWRHRWRSCSAWPMSGRLLCGTLCGGGGRQGSPDQRTCRCVRDSTDRR